MRDYGFIVRMQIPWHKSDTEKIFFNKVRYIFNRTDVEQAWQQDLRNRIGEDFFETDVPAS